MVISTNLGYLKDLNRFLFSGEKKSMTVMSISGYQLVPHINPAYQISIYVKMTMRKRTEALTTWISKSFSPSVQGFFKKILENNNLFEF